MTRLKRWSKDQQLALLNNLGVSGAAKLCRSVGGARTENAIRSKAYREYQTASITRGTYSLRALMAETGYDRTQLHRAQRALRQRWHRTRAGGNFMISLTQSDELVEWLKTDYWAARFRLYCCLWCTTEERSHRGLGLCDRCYYQYRRRCKKAGLSTKCEDLMACLERYRDKIDCVILASMAERLKRGMALSKRHLKILVGQTHAVDAGRV